MNNQTLVLSDIHGQYDLLKEALEPFYHYSYELVVLGDMFDRATPGGDTQVLELLQKIQDNPATFGFSKVTLLRGNHEQLLIDAIEKGSQSSAYDLWIFNGGDPTFYKEAGAHLDWLKSLPHYYIKDDYLFVHAGVTPGVPITEQRDADLLWVREPFLDCEDHGLPYYVVHGHTPVDTVDIKEHRMNIDTGAYYSGKLSAVVFQ